MKFARLLFVALVLVFITDHCFASPTSNEFIPCKKIAVAMLERCLSEKSYYSNEICWEQSAKAYKSCSKNVMQKHDPQLQKAKKEASKRAISDSEKQ